MYLLKGLDFFDFSHRVIDSVWDAMLQCLEFGGIWDKLFGFYSGMCTSACILQSVP